MSAVEWMRQGATVERERSAMVNLAEAVDAARWRANIVMARHPLDAPDGFRLIDTSGAVLITYKFLSGHRQPAIALTLERSACWPASTSSPAAVGPTGAAPDGRAPAER
jgi:hypothetical protein